MYEENKQFNQDDQLSVLLQDRIECTVITTNGVQIKGTVEAFDNYAVLIRAHSGKQSMIYKHALSTIISGIG